MDFGVLSKYDDLLATYFLDNFYLWFSTVRMNMDYVAPKIDTAPSIAIIRDQIVKQRDPSKAAMAFLKMPFFQEYLKDKTEKRKLEFTQHLKRYMFMFMPNAGFEINSTERYTGEKEACIMATRDWEAGEQVTCCQGAIAELNSEEDAKLKKEGRDFSVMVSTRKKCTCLFLGPARFMNHDCDANCEFILLNQNAITFRIKRNIAEGEEMTVFYGEHYFGEDNCECLCASCEKAGEGKFSPPVDDSVSPNKDSPSDKSNSNNNSNNNNTNDNNTSDGTSPTPSLSSSSSSGDRRLRSSKDDKNPRRSSRKRKDISYTDYFEPLEPKKARRGRWAKEMEPDSVLEEKMTAKREVVLDKEDVNISSSNSRNSSVDMENIDPSQTLVKQKKAEPSRHREMALAFICDIETFDERYSKWLHIPTYPKYDPNPILHKANIQDKRQLSELQSFEYNCIPGESVIVPVPPLFPCRPHNINNIPQSSFEGQFTLIPNQDNTEYLNMMRKRRKSYDDLEIFNDWTDRLSQCSDEEKDRQCCPQYNEKTANSETHMCARCHRHYCIYGIGWPVRKIRKAPGKRKAPKRISRQPKQQTLNPIEFTPTCNPSSSSFSSFSPMSSPPRPILTKPTKSVLFPYPPELPRSMSITMRPIYQHSPLVSSLPAELPTSPPSFSNTLETTTIEKFEQIRISTNIIPILDTYSTDTLTEDNNSCSRQYNSLVRPVAVDIMRENNL